MRTELLSCVQEMLSDRLSADDTDDSAYQGRHGWGFSLRLVRVVSWVAGRDVDTSQVMALPAGAHRFVLPVLESLVEVANS